MKNFLVNKILDVKKKYSFEPPQSILLEFGTYKIYLYTLKADELRTEYINLINIINQKQNEYHA